MKQEKIVTDTLKWLENVVIGLNLCPFAAAIYRNDTLDVVVCPSEDPAEFLQTLQDEIERLEKAASADHETTLLVAPKLFAQFADFNDFLDPAEALLDDRGWSGKFQLASFHPDYQFDGEDAEDPGNYTNRAPYPTLHILREKSVERAVNSYGDVSGIPERNVALLRGMDEGELRRLFGR